MSLLGQPASLASLALTLWAGSAAVWDWRSRRLPNRLTLGGMCAGLLWLAVFAEGATGSPWKGCLAAGGLAALVTLPAYGLKAMGGGDVKLSIAMGFLGGLKTLLGTLLLGGLVAGALALWLLVSGRDRPGSGRRTVPFGTALGAGFILALWAGQLHYY